MARAIPVFGGKSIKREVLDSQFSGSLGSFTYGSNPAFVAERTEPALFFGPPAVSVHNYSNMAWQTIKIYFIFEAHWLLS
jgi:hypothetical protein